jgi:hypothetical protein
VPQEKENPVKMEWELLVAQAALAKTGGMDARGKTGLVPLERQDRKESGETLEDQGCVDQPECRERKESKALQD